MHNKVMHFSCVILIIFLTLLGCEKISDVLCENEELSRLSSPDRKVEAVLVRTACGGATTPYSYRISIVPVGKNPTRSDTIFLSEKLEGCNFVWVAPKLLEISYEKARILSFRNFWQSADIDSFKYIVEIKERQVEKGIDKVDKGPKVSKNNKSDQ